MSAFSLAEALGRIPSGLFILTVGHDGRESGVLTSWVQQAGFDPPTVTVALKKDRHVAKWLGAGATFVLNVLGTGQKSLISHFGRGFDEHEEALAGLNIARTESGTPVLADALGHLECRPTKHVDSGDHRIFLAEVVAGGLSAEGEPYVHVRRNGLKY